MNELPIEVGCIARLREEGEGSEARVRAIVDEFVVMQRRPLSPWLSELALWERVDGGTEQ